MEPVSRASPTRTAGWWKKLRRALAGRTPPSTTPDTDPLTRALQIEASDPAEALKLYKLVTQTFIDAGHYQPSVQILKRATVLAPDQPDLHGMLGQCLARLGRREEAALSFRRAAALAEVQGQAAWAQQLLDTAEWVETEPAPAPSPAEPDVSQDTEPAMAAPDLSRPPPLVDLSEGPSTDPDTEVMLPALALRRPASAEPIAEPQVYHLDDEDFEPIEMTNVDSVRFLELDERSDD